MITPLHPRRGAAGVATLLALFVLAAARVATLHSTRQARAPMADAATARCPLPSAARQRVDTAAVALVEQDWGKAFMSGDTASLDCLLAPDYVSVSEAAVPRDKATILALALGHRRASAHGTPVKPAATQAGSPSSKPVRLTAYTHLVGTTAVVTGGMRSVDSTGRAIVTRASDVFSYKDGRWIAVYSQHSRAPAP